MTATTKNAIIIVGSEYGSTYEIADRLCDEFIRKKLPTVIAYPEDITSLEGYDVIILGSAVYLGKWVKPMRKFVDTFSDELLKKTCYLFSSGPVGKPLKPEYSKAVSINEIIRKTDAKEHKLFSGKLNKSYLRMSEKMITTALHIKEGDYRNWKEIKSWAKHIATQEMRHKNTYENDLP